MKTYLETVNIHVTPLAQKIVIKKRVYSTVVCLFVCFLLLQKACDLITRAAIIVNIIRLKNTEIDNGTTKKITSEMGLIYPTRVRITPISNPIACIVHN